MTRGAGWFSPPKALAKKRSAAAASRLAERRKSIESTGGVDSPVQIHPLPLNPDVSFIHAPTVAGRFQSRAQTSFHFRGVTLDPSPHRDVIGVQAPLGQQLLHITIGKRETQIPTAAR